jgi:hypothetical protein
MQQLVIKNSPEVQQQVEQIIEEHPQIKKLSKQDDDAAFQ